MKFIMDDHLSVERLVVLALSNEGNPHVDSCAFCREQINFLRDLDEFDREMSHEHEHVFSLAAATAVDEPTMQLRRTWYFEEQHAVLRVFEDEQQHILVGSLLVDPIYYGKVHLQFSDLGEDFIPDSWGRFVIGTAELDIEPMTVTLSFPTP